jgi:hypothetical protein
MSAEDYVVKNTDQQALQAYLVIFRSLPEEFKERRYVLICAGFTTTFRRQVFYQPCRCNADLQWHLQTDCIFERLNSLILSAKLTS